MAQNYIGWLTASLERRADADAVDQLTRRLSHSTANVIRSLLGLKEEDAAAAEPSTLSRTPDEYRLTGVQAQRSVDAPPPSTDPSAGPSSPTFPAEWDPAWNSLLSHAWNSVAIQDVLL